MTHCEIMAQEFELDIAKTRATLERVPESAWNWRPHDKSFAMGELATHVANLVSWTGPTLQQESFDVAPPGEEPVRTPVCSNREELLALFERTSSEALAALRAATDDELSKPWSLLMGGHVLFTMPKMTVMRHFVLNHLVHHRGQLTVYLRLNDVPLPALYGPSADEQGM